MPEPAFHLAALFVEIHIPDSGSLKSKRKVLKSIKDRVRSRFNVSVAEMDYHDKWQRSLLGFAMIGNDKNYLESSLRQISSLLQGIDSVEMLREQIDYF